MGFRQPAAYLLIVSCCFGSSAAFRASLPVTPPRPEGQGAGSSDPTSPRREASLFNSPAPTGPAFFFDRAPWGLTGHQSRRADARCRER
jgi:hypothetical protein